VQLLRETFDRNQVVYKKNASHITSVPIGDAVRCREVAAALLEQQGVYLQPINFPTVPRGEECLRVIITAKHQPKHINHLAYSLNKILNGKDTAHREEFPPVDFAIGESEAAD
jgi:5-aminolevulinate synthase